MTAGVGAKASGGSWLADFTASIVVFLVAMPLCMGIAIASGVPPEKGLITGIVGGLIVGFVAGSPLQVSGPAAGLAVIVFEFVREYGLAALAPVLVLAGVLQVAAGIAEMGGFFRSISPAVVHGMLAGIGALIVIGQFHILFDDRPLSSGLENIAAMPGKILGLSPFNLEATEYALFIGLVTIGVMLGWEKIRPASMKLVPGALLGVMAATIIAWGLGLNIARVDVPSSIMGAIDAPSDAGFFAPLAQPALLVTALAIAFIASAETLLSAAAVDRMHDGVRTDYNKELRAQGLGNLLCGFAGALPMAGVIVRSARDHGRVQIDNTKICGFVEGVAIEGASVGITGSRICKADKGVVLYNGELSLTESRVSARQIGVAAASGRAVVTNNIFAGVRDAIYAEERAVIQARGNRVWSQHLCQPRFSERYRGRYEPSWGGSSGGYYDCQHTPYPRDYWEAEEGDYRDYGHQLDGYDRYQQGYGWYDRDGRYVSDDRYRGDARWGGGGWGR